jgi:hypothetical protein
MKFPSLIPTLALALSLSALAQESPSPAPTTGAVKPTSKSENRTVASPAKTPADTTDATEASPSETAPADPITVSSPRASGSRSGSGRGGGGVYGSTQGTGIGFGGSGYGGGGAGAMSGVPYTYFSTGSSGSAVPPLILRFSEADPSANAAMEEDLNVMTRLIEKAFERTVGDYAPDVKMGIEMLFSSASRSVRALYVEGFGACWMIKVNFPVFAAATPEAKPARPTTDSEWDRTKRELYGGRAEDKLLGQPATKFEPEQVEALTKVLLQGLKNATHIRKLKADEYLAISVFGQPQFAGRTRGRMAGEVMGDAATTDARVHDQMKAAQAQLDALHQNLSAKELAVKTQQQKREQFKDKQLSAELQETVRHEMEQVRRKQEDIKREVEQVQRNLEQTRRSTSGVIIDSTSDAAPGTVLTIRATKADVDAFAKGKLDFEAFRKKAEVHAYPGAGYGLTSLNSWVKERTLTYTRVR